MKNAGILYLVQKTFLKMYLKEFSTTCCIGFVHALLVQDITSNMQKCAFEQLESALKLQIEWVKRASTKKIQHVIPISFRHVSASKIGPLCNVVFINAIKLQLIFRYWNKEWARFFSLVNSTTRLGILTWGLYLGVLRFNTRNQRSATALVTRGPYGSAWPDFGSSWTMW